MLFAIGFVSLFISGGLTGIFLGNSALDIHLHDTYFVVAHFHIVMGVASMFGMFAGVYHWFPKMFGRYLNNTLAYIHFWVTMIGAYLIFWPMHYEGLAGMPRRYYDFSNWESFKMFGGLNEFISFVALIVFAHSFYLFLISFIQFLKEEKLQLKIHGVQIHWNGQHLYVRGMATGLVKFRKFIAGLMIMVKMEGSLFRKLNRWVNRKASIDMWVNEMKLFGMIFIDNLP